MATSRFTARLIANALLALASTAMAHGQCLEWGASSTFTDSAGPLFTNSSVSVMQTFDEGSGVALYVAGRFALANGVPAHNIARFQNGAWSAVGSGGPLDGSGSVTALASYSSQLGSRLVAAVWYHAPMSTISYPRLQWWDGVAWSFFDEPFLVELHDRIDCLAAYTPAGSVPQLYAGTSSGKIHRYDGLAWSTIFEQSNTSIHSMTVLQEPTGPVLVVAGSFGIGSNPLGPAGTRGVARYDGTTWSALGNGTDGITGRLVTFDAPNATGDELFAVVSSSRVVRWNGVSWTTVGTASGGLNTFLLATSVFGDGTPGGARLYVAGEFTAIDGVAASNIASWDGSSWSAVGSGFPTQVRSLGAFGDGSDAAADLYAGSWGAIADVRAWRGCEGPGEGFCFADGSMIARCPCSPPEVVPLPGGSPFSGCGNSFNAIGASLVASGATNPDSIALTATGLTPAGFTLFIHGTAEQSSYIWLHDGSLCVGGAFTRFGAQNAVDGRAVYPNAALGHTTPLSTMSGATPGSGSVSYYQPLYRNVTANFCTAATLNFANAYRLTW